MTGFFFNYVRRNDLDPTPPTTTPIDISFGNIDASVNGFQFTNLTRGVFIPVLGPACLKEKTFTVSFCVTSQSLFTNNENRFVITANYTAEGQYSRDGDVVQDVHGKGQYRLETWEDAPFICAWVDYSNISVSNLGKVSVKDAEFSSGSFVMLSSIVIPIEPISTWLYGLSAGKYQRDVGSQITSNIREIAGSAGKGNPLAELVDSFINSLLDGNESKGQTEGEFLSSASAALRIPLSEASTVKGALDQEGQMKVNSFIQQRYMKEGRLANGCKKHLLIFILSGINHG